MTGAAQAQEWKSQVKEFRVGLLGGENTSRTGWLATTGSRNCCSSGLGFRSSCFPAADYAGVMQAIAAGQLEAAEFGASGFAGTWLDCKCVEPVDRAAGKGRHDLLLFRDGDARKLRASPRSSR